MNRLKIEELNEISINSKLSAASKNRVRNQVQEKQRLKFQKKVLWPVEILMATRMDVSLEHFYENYEQ